MLDFSVTFIFTLLNIGILYLILRVLLFKPVTKFMETRAKKIKDDISNAEEEKNKAEAMRQEYEDKLKNAQIEAESLIRSAREAARTQADQIVSEGKKEADRLVLLARGQSESERQAAMAVFKTEAAALVLAASSQLLKRELSREDSQLHAKRILEELGKDS